MNIVKEKEILALSDRAHKLFGDYHAKKSAVLSLRTEVFLDVAVEEFKNFIENEGFFIVGDIQESFKADSGDGLVIRVDRKDVILSVYMPNGESYSVTVEDTLEPLEILQTNLTTSQDSQISYYKQYIASVEKRISDIENIQFRYILHTEPRDGRYSGNNRKSYLRFQDILSVMFA